jgi:16S rRNA processing protein RimM
VAVHRSQPKKKGPDVSVPGSKKPAPAPGRASFAKRVKTRRRKAQAAMEDGRPRPSNTADAPNRTSTPPSQRKLPSLRSREERIAIARGDVAQTSVRPTPTKTAPSPKPSAKRVAQPAPAVQTSGSRPKAAAPPKPSRSLQQHEPDDGFVAVGRVLSVFGLNGELKVQSLTDNPERFAPKSRLHAGQQLVIITASRDAGRHTYIKLKGFPSRTSVEKFRGVLLQIPESELPPLAEGEFYRFQLIGLEVYDRAGAKLGTVAEVLETGATDVYRITAPDTPDLLLPATPDVVIEIDLKNKRMTVDPPAWT